jgi:putative hydrolase of the HAD superfamily
MAVTHLFIDIGGVLLTNGWDRKMRREAARMFDLDWEEMDERHHLVFGAYEEGKLSLDEYLDGTVFYEKRPFSREQFRDFMFSRSQPLPRMLDYVAGLKTRLGLKLVAVSNEGRELTIFRVKKFELDKVIDFFICSCFVHLKKPDKDIWRIALDVSAVEAPEAIYIDDRKLFVEVAESLGIRGIEHRGFESTKAALEGLGLFS